jgi:predicted RNA-binding protein (virulence factor B family)
MNTTLSPTLDFGRMNTLRLDRFAVPGAYLMAEDGSDVLLPNQYVTDDMAIDDRIEVFVYTDSEDRPVATTERPLAMRDEFGFFTVVDVEKFGAFVDWGLPKDLLVPKNRQKTPFKVGEKRFLRIVKDEQSDRLVGVERISKFLSHSPRGYHRNKEVKLLVIAQTPLGFKVIVDDAYEGLVYANEIFEPVAVGDERTGYVKDVRSDGHFDISLQPVGKAARAGSEKDKVLGPLEAAGGMLPYNSKSDPGLITKTFGLSKKAFKRALVQLQESGDIEVKETGIYLKKV